MNETIRTISPKPTSKDYIWMALDLHPEGLRIRAKSQLLYDFFKGLSNGSTTTVKQWDNLEVFNLKMIPDIKGCTLKAPGQSLLVKGDFNANLSFLPAVKIGEGIDFFLRGSLFPRTQIETFYKLARKGTQDLFAQYFAEISIAFTLSAETKGTDV